MGDPSPTHLIRLFKLEAKPKTKGDLSPTHLKRLLTLQAKPKTKPLFICHGLS